MRLVLTYTIFSNASRPTQFPFVSAHGNYEVHGNLGQQMCIIIMQIYHINTNKHTLNYGVDRKNEDQGNFQGNLLTCWTKAAMLSFCYDGVILS